MSHTQYLWHTIPQQHRYRPDAWSLGTAGCALLPLPKIRDKTPVDCLSVIGVDTGVTGTDLLAVGRRLSRVGATPATADDSFSAVPELLLVVNWRPGIGRAGGAGISNDNNRDNSKHTITAVNAANKLDSLRWFSQRRSATPHFWGYAPRGLWPQIRTRPRFLYNAPTPKLHCPTLTRLEVIGKHLGISGN